MKKFLKFVFGLLVTIGIVAAVFIYFFDHSIRTSPEDF